MKSDVPCIVQHLVCKPVAPHYLDMCGKLPGTLTLVLVSDAEREREKLNPQKKNPQDFLNTS